MPVCLSDHNSGQWDFGAQLGRHSSTYHQTYFVTVDWVKTNVFAKLCANLSIITFRKTHDT